ncbi:hypothetical protein [Streptomyces sp. BE303]|uniref:hypothetical protein n=1 Tax=Streptomyces sp. BE303 TaxID=3002528 RepID=UPI002E79022D|nr:hypothetical protein [Streptomyces sp. BE303]MED7951692.1 hypothetical protein [Streptomyces sp. BE303]
MDPEDDGGADPEGATFSTPQEGSVGLPGLFSHVTLRLSPERLVRVRAQLNDVFDELHAEGQSASADAVEVAAFALLYGVRPDAAVPAGTADPPEAAGPPPAGSRSGTRPGTES